MKWERECEIFFYVQHDTIIIICVLFIFNFSAASYLPIRKDLFNLKFGND